MPTYEYECQACDYRFEQFQSIKADAIKICPKCQGNVKRLMSAGAGFIFKGSGFYQTDYRSSSYQKKAEAEKKASGSTGGKSEGKAEPQKKSEGSTSGKGDSASPPPSKSSSDNQK